MCIGYSVTFLRSFLFFLPLCFVLYVRVPAQGEYVIYFIVLHWTLLAVRRTADGAAAAAAFC